MKIFRTALAVFLLGVAVSPVVIAREINSNPAKQDAVSFHGGDPTCYSAGYVSGCEVAVDVTGNFLPTVANAQDLGTSALPFRTVYSVTATNTGNETNGTAGTTNATGLGGTAASQSAVNGLQVFGKVALTGVVSSTSIPVNSSYETIMSTSATTVTITALPSISTSTVPGGSTEIPSGTYLVLSSTGASGALFQDNGTLSGSQLELGAATRSVTQYKTLTLIYDATDHKWREISYGNN